LAALTTTNREGMFVVAAQIRRDLYADVTGLALGLACGIARQADCQRDAGTLAALTPTKGDPAMVEANRSLSHASTKYWVDVILTTALDCRRFDCEREALAWAQVCARLPNAELVVAYALTEGRKKTIFEWSEAE
jgi:hypothetical protein